MPDAAAGRQLADLAGELGDVKVISVRRRFGGPVKPEDDTPLQGGETLVLSGKAEALNAAERALAAG